MNQNMASKDTVTVSASTERYADMTEEQLTALVKMKDARKTQDIVKTAVNIFTDYCVSKKPTAVDRIINIDHEDKDVLLLLNSVLRSFYAEIRKVSDCVP